jgi:hypothetical protein
MRMDHGADIAIHQEVHNVVLAGFHVDFDLGKAGDIGVRVSIPRVIVFRACYQALTGQRRY